MKEKKTMIGILKNNYFFLKLVFKYAPELFIWKIGLMLIGVFLQSYFSINFIEYIVASISEGQSFFIITKFLLVYLILLLFNGSLQIIFNQHINFNSKKKLHKCLHNLVFDKVKQMDMVDIENPEFYNNYIWTMNEIDNRTIVSFEIVISFLECFLSMVVVGAILTQYDILLILIAILPIIIDFFIQKKIIDFQFEYSKKNNELERKKQYFKRIFYLPQYAKEMKTFGYADDFKRRFNDIISESVEEYKKVERGLIKYGFLNIFSSNILGTCLLSFYLVYCAVVRKSIEISEVIAAFAALGIFSERVRTVGNILQKMRANELYAEKIFKIINYKSHIEGSVGISLKRIKKIEIQNLTFAYPTSNNNALEKVSIQINAGEKVAIVGLNGSGKTTFIKLLLRLYDPDGGKILINNNNICDYDIENYRSKFSVLFQDFQQYAISLKDNITLKNECSKEKEVLQALSYADVEKYKLDLMKDVTREFSEEGLVFSGGESQKIALARVLVDNAEVVILDEPTSALDPLSESVILKNFESLFKNKTVIFISHKLSIVNRADRIYFFEGGKILEEGTHEELISGNGRYAELYEIQREMFS